MRAASDVYVNLLTACIIVEIRSVFALWFEVILRNMMITAITRYLALRAIMGVVLRCSRFLEAVCVFEPRAQSVRATKDSAIVSETKDSSAKQ